MEEPLQAVRLAPDLGAVHRRSSVSAQQRHRSSSSSSLSVSACSISSTVSSYPAPSTTALRPCWHLAADQSYEDYEVRLPIDIRMRGVVHVLQTVLQDAS